MDRVVNRTVDVLTRFGEHIERHLTTDNTDDEYYVRRSDSASFLPSENSAFSRPLDKKSKIRSLTYGNRRRDSSDNLVASAGYSSFDNYRQNSVGNSPYNRLDLPRYENSLAFNANNPYESNFARNSNISRSGFYGNDGHAYNYNHNMQNIPYGAMQGNVAYSPDYYVAERRQIELIPAPPPRIIQQPVPVAVPVDRPVYQPYPVEVPRPYPVDRPVPVPVPVPTPVPVDRPVLVPVPVPSPPVCVPVPVPVPSPVPCYVPVSVPVPSPAPSPVMFEQSVTNSQRWVTGSPVFMNQPSYSVGSQVVNMNPYGIQRAGSFMY